MKIYYAIILFSMMPLVAVSQVTNWDEYKSEDFFDDGILGNNYAMNGYTLKEKVSEVGGNIYLLDSWANRAELILKNGKKITIENLGVNYNILEDRFELKTTGDSIFIMNSDVLEKVLIHKKKFNKLSLKKNTPGFVEVLFDNKDLLLYKKYSLRIKEGKLNPLNGEKSPNKFQELREYFLVKNKQLVKVKLNRKKIEAVLQPQNNKMHLFMKSNKLSFKKEEDIIKLLEYLYQS